MLPLICIIKIVTISRASVLKKILTDNYMISLQGCVKMCVCVCLSVGCIPPSKFNICTTVQVGKLKVLCESFFKLKSIKLRLFLQEEVCEVHRRFLPHSTYRISAPSIHESMATSQLHCLRLYIICSSS